MKLRAFRAAVPSWARYDIWNVGIATLERPLEDIADLAHLTNVRWLPPQPPLHLVADPFPYRYDGRDWLLAEYYAHPRGIRGRIVRVGTRNESMKACRVAADDVGPKALKSMNSLPKLKTAAFSTL